MLPHPGAVRDVFRTNSGKMRNWNAAHREENTSQIVLPPWNNLSMLRGPMMHRRVHGSTGQMRHLTNTSGHVEDRRRRVALRTERAVSAAVYMVLTNVVFAGKGMLKVPGALVNGGAFWAATLSVVHAGSHFSLTFHYGTKSSTNPLRQCTKVTIFFITKRECETPPSHHLSRTGITRHKS